METDKPDSCREHAGTCIAINGEITTSYTLLNNKFSEESVGLCEEMGLQPISELFTTDGGLLFSRSDLFIVSHQSERESEPVAAADWQW